MHIKHQEHDHDHNPPCFLQAATLPFHTAICNNQDMGLDMYNIALPGCPPTWSAGGGYASTC